MAKNTIRNPINHMRALGPELDFDVEFADTFTPRFGSSPLLLALFAIAGIKLFIF